MIAVREQSHEICQLQYEFNELEQYSRRANLEIHGLPFDKNEQLVQVIQQLAEKLEVDLDNKEVVAAHRLQAKRNGIPPVLIRFSSPVIKERWVSCRGKLRALVEEEGRGLLFFHENLTAFNKNLFWKARLWGKEKRFKFGWVKNGRILVKRSEEASLIRIKGYADLDLIV